MGWLVWMCLGAARDKSSRSRIGGRVSSETYLAPQYDPTTTPRIEDYLQPRGEGGYDVSEKYLVAGGQKEYRRCVSESLKGEYGPYWGYAEDQMAVEDFVAIEFPRARKSFSELLIETDTLENGPLALAAVAVAKERAVKSKQQEGPPSKVEAASSEPASKHESISSLSKEHLEASNAVAAFRESRRKSTQQQPQNSLYISTLFRKQRSLPPTRSRSFQSKPLSPVPEVLSLEEELQRNRRKTDVATSTMKSPAKHQQGSDEWDDYVIVDRTQQTTATSTSIDAPTSASIDARISSSSSSQDDVTSSSPQLLDQTSPSSSPQVQDQTSSSTLLLRDVSSSSRDVSLSSGDVSSSSSLLLQHELVDESLMRTPVRDPVVTPEVFISPKTSTAELNFTRVTDMEPEERLIFGSLADHWEAAWATKGKAWDGQGIPNSTNKYREDQKVMWHAAPFEERLAQALASQQQDSLPRRRNSFTGRTSRLAASRTSTSLQAH